MGLVVVLLLALASPAAADKKQGEPSKLTSKPGKGKRKVISISAGFTSTSSLPKPEIQVLLYRSRPPTTGLPGEHRKGFLLGHRVTKLRKELKKRRRDVARTFMGLPGFETPAVDWKGLGRFFHRDRLAAHRAAYRRFALSARLARKETEQAQLGALLAGIHQLERGELSAYRALRKKFMAGLSSGHLPVPRPVALLTLAEVSHRLSVARPPALQKRRDHRRSMGLARKLLAEFPDHAHAPWARYLLGYWLTEMGRDAEGHAAFRSMICSNRYALPAPEKAGALKTETNTPTRSLGTGRPQRPQFNINAYKGCRLRHPGHSLNAEVWMRLGQYHFDQAQYGEAISAYGRVVSEGPRKNRYFDGALGMMAWAHFRADQYAEAIRSFDRLVVHADDVKRRTGVSGSLLRSEAIQYLGISFVWKDEGVPGPRWGLHHADMFYGKRTEGHVFEVYWRVAEIYHLSTRYDRAIKIYRRCLARWPERPESPLLHNRIILALERLRRFDDAKAAREEFVHLFGEGSPWQKQNRAHAGALEKARELEEQAIIQLAVYHHKMAQVLKRRGEAGDASEMKEATRRYALATEAYKKYLDRFPNSKNTYDIHYSYAFCLFFSGRLAEAGAQFEAVRDSHLDHRLRENAAHSAIKAYEESIRYSRHPTPELPSVTRPPKSLEPLALPRPFLRLQRALDAYVRLFPKKTKAPRLTYQAAKISYRFLHFDDARKRFIRIYRGRCGQYFAYSAAKALLDISRLQKDPNRMKLAKVRLERGRCIGRRPTPVVQPGRFHNAMMLLQAKKWNKAASAFLARVDAYPRSQDADKALNNAAVCYERLRRYSSAIRIYDRIWQQYPNRPMAHEALWRTALNYKRLFQFSKAVTRYLILANNPKFSGSPHRLASIHNAAKLLKNDGDNKRAAALYLRYAQKEGATPRGAGAHLQAVTILEKSGSLAALKKAVRDFRRIHGKVPGQAANVVEGHLSIGRAAHRRKRWSVARRHYRRAVTEFTRRGLQPGSVTAGHVARAEFQLLEHRLRGFLKMKISGGVKARLASRRRMERRAAALEKAYEKLGRFKRLRWTLASLCRRGRVYEHLARSVQGRSNVKINKELEAIWKKAQTLYASGTTRARKLGLTSTYTDDAARRLHALAPASPLPQRVLELDRLLRPPGTSGLWKIHDSGRYDKAILLARGALASKPGDTDAMEVMAHAYYRLGKLGLARYVCDRAIEVSPKRGQCHALRGFIARKGSEHAAALKHFHRASQAQPTMGHFWLNLGAQYITLRRPAAARLSLRHAVRLMPRRAGAHLNLGIAHMDAEKPLEARKSYRAAQKLKPNHPPVSLLLGVLYLDTPRLPGMSRLAQLNSARAFFDQYKKRKAGLTARDPVHGLIKEVQAAIKRQQRSRDR